MGISPRGGKSHTRAPFNSPSEEVDPQTQRSDIELMTAVRDGDVATLGVLFDRYHVRLYNFFVRHTNRRDASEDLVQDVFLRMLKYRQTYRGDAPFTVWMYQLAKNAASDWFKKWKQEFPLDDEVERQRDTEPLPSEAREQAEEHEILRKALANISEEKREVLLMSRFEGLKYEEIGRILKSPVGTIKARVHFALKDLRDEYTRLTKEKV